MGVKQSREAPRGMVEYPGDRNNKVASSFPSGKTERISRVNNSTQVPQSAQDPQQVPQSAQSAQGGQRRR